MRLACGVTIMLAGSFALTGASTACPSRCRDPVREYLVLLDRAPIELPPHHLLDDDGSPRELGCPRSVDPGRQIARGVACVFPARTIRLRGKHGTTALRVILIVFDRTAEENFHRFETAVVLGPAREDGAPTVLHVTRQLMSTTWDDGQAVLIRRQRVHDLDRDGDDELCIESRSFTETRTESVERFAFEVDGGRLVRAARLDRRCPRRGYQPFVPPPRPGGAFTWESDGEEWQRLRDAPAK